MKRKKRPHTEITKQKLRDAHLGRKHTKETKKKIGETQLGKKRTEETKREMRAKHICNLNCQCVACRAKREEDYNRGKNHSMFGKHHSKESKRKMQEIKLGKKLTEETKRKIGIANKGKKRTNEIKKKMSIANRITMKRLWQNPKYAAKQMKAIHSSPNQQEKFLEELLEELFPNEYKYVGSGDFFLGGKCPDFIHNKQKKIIEMFGDYWHGEGRTGISNEQHEQERINIFAKEGYQTLVIWQHEMDSLENLRNKIIAFGSKHDYVVKG